MEVEEKKEVEEKNIPWEKKGRRGDENRNG